jgi:hypothetical protein
MCSELRLQESKEVKKLDILCNNQAGGDQVRSHSKWIEEGEKSIFF